MKNIVEGFNKHLKDKGLRLTSERVRLLEIICSMKGHFSADDVLARVKSQRSSGSRATLYRLLPVLVEAGFIQQSLFSEGQTRFEVTWNRAHHDHLICSQCNKVIEFQNNAIEILQREIANRFGFILDHHVMELVGRCKECRKNRMS
jgi:Fur family transcriptional regulator, ferric uptake regulator